MTSSSYEEYMGKFTVYLGINLYFIITHLILANFDIYYEFFDTLLRITKIVSLFIICINSFSFKFNECFGYILIFAISIIELMYIIIHCIIMYKFVVENDNRLPYLIWEFTNNIQFWITSWAYCAFNMGDTNTPHEDNELDSACCVCACIFNCVGCILVILEDILKLLYSYMNVVFIIPTLQGMNCIYQNIIYPSYKYICNKLKNMYNCLRNSFILCKNKIFECCTCNLSCECICKFGENKSTTNNINSDITLVIENEFTCHICPICLDNINPQSYEICILECKHTYHKACIEEWDKTCPTNKNNKTNATCPECRTEFVLSKTSFGPVTQV